MSLWRESSGVAAHEWPSTHSLVGVDGFLLFFPPKLREERLLCAGGLS